MLVRYKKSCQKIAMGLLSFMPQERNLKSLCQTITRYAEDPDWQLYLLKNEEDYIGLIGVEVADTYFTVHHISVLPSFRGEGLGRKMIEKIQVLMQDREMRSTKETEALLNHCLEKVQTKLIG
ncbi:GNAT family N-acetyltransferase [Planococcus shenhongbingii]|uniref:GNAT family N-acetyltransferase n=1 Tax=Planococcus shenhongbingii TaxID=3058398 RepID=A0ABT8NBT1_9BACL|nr:MULTISPECIES: GNAT family N-acetyltransferase [unclassified Planococcus (in: firmicutes)]MDN7245316.1 GNAT family N-acetyltransferase [Planococcus sp. N017]WKA58420.1 GNAT family N-acetyltransferase [Planococcus sp. N016]